MLLFAPPIARDSARAVNSRFNAEDLSQLSAVTDLLHCKVVNIPTAVLMYRKKPAAFF